ncbi:TIGR02099 family protein [Xylophilus rhododendri]|uniref:TIGR02099 family protein n=1 Tax=Xylophilus rhododendri TaxID=2697032 RepID=A0A857J6S0_9BURK|nr:YhdP family protein [Xylophilus rhododendri]QHI98779.1 TIGR02099 family protein [Xylophilus rhododendri]
MRIATITARSGWLVPSFALSDVTVLDREGRTALRLPLVVAALSPRSLLHLGFEQLYLEGPELDVRRTADGRLFVAGQELHPDPSGGGRGADWLFSQTEVVVRHGTLRWTDEAGAAAPQSLTDIELLLRNGGWRHAMRIAATPPAELGGRVTLVGQFSQPLLSLRPGQWRDWQGPFYAGMPDVDLGRLHAQLAGILGSLSSPAPLFGLSEAAGKGSLQAWADLDAGAVSGVTADVALQDLALRFAEAPAPLALRQFSARLSGRRDEAGFELATERLAFVSTDGDAWPGGNLSLRHLNAAPGRTEIGADRLDLAELARIASGLPLGAQAQRLLAERAPQGLVESLTAHWEGGEGAATRYAARGRVTGLSVSSIPPDADHLAAAAAVEAALRAQDPHGHRHVHPPLGRPGIRGADLDFDLDQTGGKASLAVRSGALDVPGVFADPVVPLDSLRAELRWQHGADGRLAVQVPHAEFANADAAGALQASWRSGDEADPAQRLPGVLDLTGHMTRADGTRVWRYLPQSIAPEARDYVRESVSAGVATSADFRVQGDLRHMPFDDPKLGQFRIAARLRDVTYAYAPPEIEHEGALPWPALVRLAGELVFEGRGMEIRNASGRLESPESMRATGARGAEPPAPRSAKTPPLLAGEVQVLRADVRIPDLSRTVVNVQARARGPLAEMLAIVDAAPLAGMTRHALSHATADGNAELQLGLSLPVAALHDSRVRGEVVLGGNDLRLAPQLPLLGQARGTVAFSEGGFSLFGTQARMLGGDLQVEGGLQPVPGAVDGQGAPLHRLSLQARGTLTAEGLRDAPELGAVPRLAAAAQGGTSYSVTVESEDGHPQVSVSSSLQGLALDLPAPLGKSAEASLPLRFQTRLLPAAPGEATRRDELTMDLGDVVAVRYLRSLEGDKPRVIAGSLAIGLQPGEEQPLPTEGVAANVHLAQLDVDAWRAVLRRVAEQAGTGTGTADAAAATQRSESADYLPDTLALRADEFTAAGRTLHQVVVGGSHEAGLWRANVDARELGGYLEYRQAADAAPARVYARLARLQVPETAAQDVESLTDSSVQPASSAAAGPLPALDIVVDDFQLKDRRLGRLEVQAVNRDAEWRLDKLQLAMPEATFAATGRWGRRAPGTPRRTEFDFRLDLRDSGALLGRLGMPGVIARGVGQLSGQVDWQGSPFSPDYASMDGKLHLDVASGQFLKADPGLAKLLGVLSLQSLPRRLTLDFRDVFSEGFAFDHVRGDVQIADGIAHTDQLEMKGVAATVQMDGSADIRRETQNLRVVVVPEINAGTASLLAAMVNPAIGLSTFLAQAVLRGPLIEAATQEFDITGGWTTPHIVKVARPAATP